MDLDLGKIGQHNLWEIDIFFKFHNKLMLWNDIDMYKNTNIGIITLFKDIMSFRINLWVYKLFLTNFDHIENHPDRHKR